MVNVLYVILNLGQGGAERVVIDLAKGLDRSRFKPMVCCLYDKGPFAGELEEAGINVMALNKKHRIEPSIIKRIAEIVKKNNIDVVHTHLWGPNFWGRIAAKKAGVKVIIATEHNEDVWKGKLYFFFDKWLAGWTDRIIVVSKNVKSFYVNRVGLDPAKIKVIYNGINVDKKNSSHSSILQLKKEFGINEGEDVLAVVGRLVPQKGHRYFLLALKELIRERKVKGLIVGAGYLEGELKSLSRSLGLENRVLFTGLRTDVQGILGIVNALIVPSLREGLPIVALEAMAAGVPVVASEVGGLPEMITHEETGILVEPKNYPALKEAISKLLADGSLSSYIKENAKRKVYNEFSIDNAVTETQALYEKLYLEKIGK
ncbi:MAG: glycosyltransferase [Candidatus Omnitrophica bacterium]|nr:glycosyltransferase [Candidatus Omnitrophota bacterium]